jgi:hypothetical protein
MGDLGGSRLVAAPGHCSKGGAAVINRADARPPPPREWIGTSATAARPQAPQGVPDGQTLTNVEIKFLQPVFADTLPCGRIACDINTGDVGGVDNSITPAGQPYSGSRRPSSPTTGR